MRELGGLGLGEASCGREVGRSRDSKRGAHDPKKVEVNMTPWLLQFCFNRKEAADKMEPYTNTQRSTLLLEDNAKEMGGHVWW